MSRYDDYAPIGNTCPMINNVISFLEKLNLEDKDLSIECIEMVKEMEKIRDANYTLRKWGNSECREREGFEKERDDFEKDIKNLNFDIEDLHTEIKNLNKRINELEEVFCEI